MPKFERSRWNGVTVIAKTAITYLSQGCLPLSLETDGCLLLLLIFRGRDTTVDFVIYDYRSQLSRFFLLFSRNFYCSVSIAVIFFSDWISTVNTAKITCPWKNPVLQYITIKNGITLYYSGKSYETLFKACFKKNLQYLSPR